MAGTVARGLGRYSRSCPEAGEGRASQTGRRKDAGGAGWGKGAGRGCWPSQVLEIRSNLRRSCTFGRQAGLRPLILPANVQACSS